MRRPLVPVVILFAIGILVARSIEFSPWFPVVAAGALFFPGLCWGRGRIAVLGLVVCAGATVYALRTAALSPYDLRRIVGTNAALVSIRGTLLESPMARFDERGARSVSRVEVSALRFEGQEWRRAAGEVVVSTPVELTNWFGGQGVELFGVLERPRVAAAEGLFDYRAYLGDEGIYYQLRAASEKDWHRVGPVVGPGLMDRFRRWAKRELARGLPVEDESLRLEWALTLGWKPALTEAASEPFIRAATYHIFAVDGLRMAILFGIFFSLFRAAGIPRPVSGLVLVPLIWFYVGLTGWPASAVRAAVMLSVVILSWVFKRPSDLVNSLAAAAVILLVWEPRELFKAGFQLSFAVVFCIVVLLPRLRAAWLRLWAADPLLPARLRPKWRKWFRRPALYVGDLLLTSFVAWLGSLPLVAYYFNVITPVSTPANIVAVPLCALALMSNLAALLFAWWLPAAAVLLNHAGWFFMECIRVSSEWFAAWPGAYAYTTAPRLFTTCAFYALLLGMGTGWLFRPRLRKWRWAAVVVLSGAWLVMWCTDRVGTRITILALSTGYAIDCDFPGRKDDLLIDCGNTNAVQFVTKPFLRARGINRLNALALSHGDARQIGGMLLVNALFRPKEVFTGPLPFRSPVYHRGIERLGESHVVGRGGVLSGWTVLHPDTADKFPLADDKPLVLTRKVQGKQLLFLSDLGRAGQEALLERLGGQRADIIVAGLPAKGEALSEGLLDALHPRLIVVCDSEFPASARASPALRARLARRRTPVIYLRDTGTVTLEFSRSRWELRAMNGLRMKELPPEASPLLPSEITEE